jgi:hypothetical protein
MFEDDISVIISSSVIPSHPSTRIIEETIGSIRAHLPDVQIFVMLDGLREEQKDREADYKEYTRRLMWRMFNDKDDDKMLVIPCIDFMHQAHMTIRCLDRLVKTPLILFCEHDTPLMDDRFIDWNYLSGSISSGLTNHVRLHYDESIHPDHQHMMQGNLTPFLIKTVQYHNRPFLADAAWFLQLLMDNFRPESRSWIEDKVYSPISYSPWELYKLTVYDPHGTGKEMKRSRDLDGRAGDKKFDPVF